MTVTDLIEKLKGLPPGASVFWSLFSNDERGSITPINHVDLSKDGNIVKVGSEQN